MTPTKTIQFAGYNLDIVDGKTQVRRETVKLGSGDYGADPVGDGTFRMVPSGDIVSWEERCKRLEPTHQRGTEEGR